MINATVIFDMPLKVFGDTIGYVLNTDKSKFRFELDGEWVRIYNKRAVNGLGRASIHVSRVALYEPEWAPPSARTEAETVATDEELAPEVVVDALTGEAVEPFAKPKRGRGRPPKAEASA